MYMDLPTKLLVCQFSFYIDDLQVLESSRSHLLGLPDLSCLPRAFNSWKKCYLFLIFIIVIDIIFIEMFLTVEE